MQYLGLEMQVYKYLVCFWFKLLLFSANMWKDPNIHDCFLIIQWYAKQSTYVLLFACHKMKYTLVLWQWKAKSLMIPFPATG